MKKETTTTLLLRRLTTPVFTLLIAVGLIGFSGCDVFIDDGETSRSSRVELRIDAEPIPVDFIDEANVKISRVELVGHQTGRVTVSNDDRTINLLDLTSGASALLGEEHVRPGTYQEVRLFIDDAEIEFEDGTKFDIDVPNSRVTIDLDDFRIRGNENVVLTFTLDAEDSFEIQGDPDSPEGITGFTFDPHFVSTDVDRSDWDGRDDHHDDDDDDDDDHDD